MRHSSVIDVSAGGAHTGAPLSTGGVRCWSLNNNGQLGNGSGVELNPGPPVDIPDVELLSTR